MKKKLLTFVAILSVLPFLANAQWSGTDPGPIYYNSGNVGIGLTSPTSKLQIKDTSNSRPGGISAATISVLKLSRAGTPSHSYEESGEFRIGHGGSNVWGSKLDLYLNGSGNSNGIPDQQVMTWLYNGNVGIGTTNPRALLNVGKALLSGDLSMVLARLNEGNTTGAGTYLGIKGYDTQVTAPNTDPSLVKSFAIEYSFYGSTNSSINFFRGGGTTGGSIAFNTDQNTEKMRILANGYVVIGTTTPDSKLAVNGTIHTQEVKVDMTGWSDYVFKPSYKLIPLSEVKSYIDQNQHLPEVPSEEEVKKTGSTWG